MKIKTSFVTNSSSTAYFFLTKGKTKNELYHLIREESQMAFVLYDELGEDGKIKCDEDDVISELQKLGRKIKFRKIENLIEEYESEEKRIIENKPYNDDFHIEYEFELVQKIALLKRAKDNGFLYYLEVEFGDHDGHIQGDVGSLVDYNRVTLFSKNLLIINENRH